MKKTIILIAFILLAFIPEKKYKFEFNDAELNALYNCIDNSTASHVQVKEIEALIQQQLKGQLDTTKHK
jgi:hypothetical protein